MSLPFKKAPAGKQRLQETMVLKDHEGGTFVSVQLRGYQARVHLSEQGYARVTEVLGGRDVSWDLVLTGVPHVVARRHGRGAVHVARLLLDLPPRGRVHYADDNPANLREENLRRGLKPGPRI